MGELDFSTRLLGIGSRLLSMFKCKCSGRKIFPKFKVWGFAYKNSDMSIKFTRDKCKDKRRIKNRLNSYQNNLNKKMVNA